MNKNRIADFGYQAALDIVEALTRLDPANTLLQHDLAVSRLKIGNMLKAQGDLLGAHAYYHAALNIVERSLAATPPMRKYSFV